MSKTSYKQRFETLMIWIETLKKKTPKPKNNVKY